jgi:RNA polymerase sigma-70 factor (sigma-E family)
MDDEGFAAYVAARWPALVRSLVMLGCDPHEAEDVVQTALIRCYSAWDRVSRADDSDAYVYRSVLNTWSKSRRRHWWGERPTPVLPESGSADAAELAMTRHDIERALGRLSNDHRTVLVLRFVADLSEHEVARVLRVPPGTVKSRTARALAQVELADLREELS